MVNNRTVAGNKRSQASGSRRHNTRSGGAPFPSSRTTRVPPVKGARTERFSRQQQKMNRKGKYNLKKDTFLAQERRFFETRARHFKEYLDKHSRTCAGVRLADLRKHRITVKAAQQKFEQMINSKMTPDSNSGRWFEDVEVDPEWLVIYAGKRVGEDGKVYKDGFTVGEMKYTLENTQDLYHELPPTMSLEGDQRHSESVKYPFLDYDILSDEEGNGDGAPNADAIFGPDATESIGLRHDVDCWRMQGGPHDPPLPSTDLRGKATATGAKAVRKFIAANQLQATYLDELIKVLAPEQYKKLKPAARAGRWYREADEGCFLGLTTVWKLQVGVHRDPKDWELCVIVSGGNFTGGHLYLPDLNLCLAYNPGDIVIFRSPYLYHAISPWEPGPMLPGDTCTPGRVSWVHFTHADVLEQLHDKEPGFFANGGEL